MLTQPLFRFISVFIFIISFTLILSPAAQAFMVSPQYDVNKYWLDIPTSIDPYNTTDHNMCWAATAANVLTYTGWAVDVTDGGDLYPTEYDAYHKFLENFPDEPGTGYLAYENYFDWYYPALNYEDYYIKSNLYVNNTTTKRDMVQELKWFLTDDYPDDPYDGDYGVYLSIFGHAVTVWGLSDIALYPYANPAQGIMGNPVYELYITDSDDMAAGIQTYFIELDNGTWRLTDYFYEGSYALFRIDALAMRPNQIEMTPGVPISISKFLDPSPEDFTPVRTISYYLSKGDDDFMPEGPRSPRPVPEPATMLLFGAGLVGFTLSRRKV